MSTRIQIDEPTIFRVPQHVQRGREHLFCPQIVSIGTYYHGKSEFAEMEEVKVQFLQELLKDEAQWKSCLSKVKKLEGEARRCYFPSTELGSEEFAKMLLQDGCFIIRFLLLLTEWTPLDSTSPTNAWSWGPKSKNKGVCGRRWIQDMIIHDLLLLENQIPFFVLETLHDHLVKINSNIGQLHELMDKLFLRIKLMNCTPMKVDNHKHEYHHLVQLYHACIRPDGQQRSKAHKSIKDLLRWLLRHLNITKIMSKIFSLILSCFQKQIDDTQEQPRSIPSLTRLREAGVELEKKPGDTDLFDISFTWDGLLEIPKITLSHEMSCLLANLVAFEQCTGAEEQPVSDYAIVMDHLVDTPADAELLVNKGILERMIPSNEDVAMFFNQLSNSCRLSDDNKRYKNMFKRIDNYNRTFWHAWSANLMRRYFSNPWSIISIWAASSLMFLTLLQIARRIQKKGLELTTRSRY